jgi:hypothetical protein
MKRVLTVLLLAGAASQGHAEAKCTDARLQLRWETGHETFSVEVADETAERARGLMFRETLDLGAGMLFVYDSPHHPQFWMKNTLIPLDIIFADMTGKVTRVHANAIPQDLTPIDGGEGVGFVLEINGGLAEKLGIGPGTEFRHPTIPQDNAAWPCDG